jgi:hypothetical protein
MHILPWKSQFQIHNPKEKGNYFIPYYKPPNIELNYETSPFNSFEQKLILHN